jgi:hypothetical protein
MSNNRFCGFSEVGRKGHDVVVDNFVEILAGSQLEGMTFTVDLVHNDPQRPNIVLQAEDGVLDHRWTEIGRTTPQSVFASELSER